MICDECQREADHYVRKLTKTGFRTQCRACKTGKVRPSVYSPFSDLSLDHVRDSQNRPIHVSSLRQLRQVEKENHCSSLIANADEAHFNDPPQQKVGNAFDAMTEDRKWLHPEIAIPMYKEMKERGEVF